jgi:hypothetical protein
MKRVVANELMDGPIESVPELEANFADIEFANRFFARCSTSAAAAPTFRSRSRATRGGAA